MGSLQGGFQWTIDRMVSIGYGLVYDYIFEQFGFPFEVIYPQALDAGNLRAKYDAIVLVSGVFTRASLQVATGILAGSAVVVLKIDFGSETQVLMLIGADVVMLIAGLVACTLPLRRALRINPTDALRAEA